MASPVQMPGRHSRPGVNVPDALKQSMTFEIEHDPPAILAETGDDRVADDASDDGLLLVLQAVGDAAVGQ